MLQDSLLDIRESDIVEKFFPVIENMVDWFIDTYEEERNTRIAIEKTKLMMEFLLDELEIYADTFSNGIEWDVNLFMFVRRWENEHEEYAQPVDHRVVR